MSSLTRLNDPVVTYDSSNTSCVAWTPDGTYLAVGYPGTVYGGGYVIHLFKRSGTSMTHVDAKNPTAGGECSDNGFDWDPSGTYLVATIYAATSGIAMFKRTGDTIAPVSFVATYKNTTPQWHHDGIHVGTAGG